MKKYIVLAKSSLLQLLLQNGENVFSKNFVLVIKMNVPTSFISVYYKEIYRGKKTKHKSSAEYERAECSLEYNNRFNW